MMTLISDPTMMFVAASVLGMMLHYVKKWARGETISSFTGYMFKDYIGYSITAMVALAGADAAILMSGTIPTMGVGLASVMGVMTGYTVDSAANKGATA